MHFMFVDESGCLGSLPLGVSSIQPVLCVVGLMVPSEVIGQLTHEWVDLKRRFFPGLCPAPSKRFDWHLAEVKGADLRSQFRNVSGNRNAKRHAVGFLNKCHDLLGRHKCQFAARVWIKNPGQPFKGTSAYTTSVQALCADFQRKLHSSNSTGIVIADSRSQGPNVRVSHSVFTQKCRAAGDPYSRIVEAPVFGHSDNHAGIQLADLLASAFLFPICTHFYLNGKVQNSHIFPGYHQLADRFVPKLKQLQYRYHSPSLPTLQGGLVVSDPVGKRGAAQLFARHPAATSPSSTLVTTSATPASVTMVTNIQNPAALPPPSPPVP